MSVTPGILQGDQFSYLQQVPAAPGPFVLNEAQTLCAEAPYGNILLQYFQDQHYTAWICDVNLEKRTTLQAGLPGSSLALLYMLTGKASLLAPYGSLQLQEQGCTLLHGPEAPALSIEPGYSRIMLLLFNPLLTSLLDNTAHPVAGVLNISCNENCRRLINDILQNKVKGDTWRFKRQVLFLDLLFSTMHEFSCQQGRPRHRDFGKLEEVRGYIRENVGKKMSLQTLADRFDIPAAQLRYSYKQVYKHHLTDYIRQERLSRAKLLLYQTDMPVHEIAWEVGYESAASFARIFNALYKQSPSAFRHSRRRECNPL
ncbi:helix-turn-helix domain-containing protein [Chitinophaga sp. XS-30]|uniref:helix-turn-helix domain-containing protein n=1 Tax=Chitinophaga sp. XS-30 TaxID=2604421 RepID=UPI0011DD1375|nr:AraC family transcriptional regulator [Chitinophaga sp. XS-30]QEH40898.1 helix-turn-helix transcriptional regulator [Chitinophaga sp. XS-30]